jgi:hypothetical protein
MKNSRLLIVVAVLLIVLAVGVATYLFLPKVPAGSAGAADVCTGGIYNANVTPISTDELGKEIYNLTYTKQGVEQNGLYYASSANAISWIKANTSTTSTFLNIWDYGKEIIGCTGRNSVVSNPSTKFIQMGFTKNVTKRDSEQLFTDVSNAFFTTNASLTKSITLKYGANYVFITTEDVSQKAPYFLKYLGLNSTAYLTPSGYTFNPNDWTSLGKQTVIYRLWNDENVPGFTLVYSDMYVKIFTVS